MPKVSVLFVCLGNICRSPMAESIFRHKVTKAGLDDQIFIDSAGTGNWHEGDNPDPRTIRVLSGHGIHLFSRARQVRTQDFQTFDYIVAMDYNNVSELKAWVGSDPRKVSLMLDWNPETHGDVVPDPYYGELKEFESVYALLNTATDHLLATLIKNHDLVRTREA